MSSSPGASGKRVLLQRGCLSPFRREKVKNSSPKKLSADCWPMVGRQLADSWTTVGRQSTDSRPIVGQLSFTAFSASSRPTVGPFVGRLSADCWPHVGNLLAKCRLRTLVEYQKSLSSQGRTLHIDEKLNFLT